MYVHIWLSSGGPNDHVLFGLQGVFIDPVFNVPFLTFESISGMNPNTDILFADSKQSRSEKTLSDILDAANLIVEEGDPRLFTTRNLAQKSGYALGTLVRRLQSIENVYLWAIKKTRDRLFKELSISMTQIDVNTPIEVFAESLIDQIFTTIQKVNPAVMRFFESRVTKVKGIQADYFFYMDVVIEPYLNAVKSNKTNTFRELSLSEASLLLRNICLLIERPFMENNPIAGTPEHRQIIIGTIIRVLGK